MAKRWARGLGPQPKTSLLQSPRGLLQTQSAKMRLAMNFFSDCWQRLRAWRAASLRIYWVCIYWVDGNCKKGGACTFKHAPDSYQHDYNKRHVVLYPVAMSTSGRISGDFFRLLYILYHRQADKYFARLGILDPSPEAFKQRRAYCGTYFYYNRAVIGLVCTQAIAMRIDIALQKRPLQPQHPNVARPPSTSSTFPRTSSASIKLHAPPRPRSHRHATPMLTGAPNKARGKTE